MCNELLYKISWDKVEGWRGRASRDPAYSYPTYFYQDIQLFLSFSSDSLIHFMTSV